MLSRLKGMETVDDSTFGIEALITLDMLSRLKGMETTLKIYQSAAVRLNFGYAFPFEGNGNTTIHCEFATSCTFGYAFPFEGN